MTNETQTTIEEITKLCELRDVYSENEDWRAVDETDLALQRLYRSERQADWQAGWEDGLRGRPSHPFYVLDEDGTLAEMGDDYDDGYLAGWQEGGHDL